MVATRRVPDEVWQSLPATRLPRGRVLATVGALVALLVVAAVLARLGIVVPRLSVTGGGGSVAGGSRQFQADLTVRNDGRLPVVLTGAGVTAPGIAAQQVEPGRVVLEPAQSARVAWQFRVTDCSTLRPQPAEVVLTAHGPAGERHVTVQPPPSVPESAGDGGTITSDGPAPPWPYGFARLACRPSATATS